VRDDENGMLPAEARADDGESRGLPGKRRDLDPFCGSGTVLMEAALATKASKIIGSDNSAEQVAATAKNLEWCVTKRILRPDDAARFKVFQADVRNLSRHVQNRKRGSRS